MSYTEIINKLLIIILSQLGLFGGLSIYNKGTSFNNFSRAEMN